MTEAKVEAKKPAVPPTRMQLAEQVRNIWALTVPVDTTIKDLLDPGYWAHLARQLQPGDRIEVEPDNGAYFAELRVLDAGNQYAKVMVLREVKLDVVEPSASVSVPGHTVEWSGRHTKWRVVRDADRKTLKDGLPTKADGYGWLANYSKALAA
jgi:hypothetical protein